MMMAMAATKRKHPKFFVNASTGSDSNNGLSTSTAVATIGKVDTLSPGPAAGDIVTVAPGTYNDLGGPTVGILITKGGSAGKPVVYMCENRWAAKIMSSGSLATTSELAMIQIRNSSVPANANYVTLKNFELDMSTAGSNYDWVIEICASGCTLENLKIHDYETNLTDWNNNIARHNYGGYIHPDCYYSAVDGTTIKNCMLLNFGPTGQRNLHTGHGIYVDGQTNGAAGSHPATNTAVVNTLFSNLCGQAVTSYNTFTSYSIQNCTFYNCGNYATNPYPSGALGEGVVFDNTGVGATNTFSNCLVRNSVFHSTGECVEENENAGTGNAYTYNTFYNVKQTAVVLVSGSTATVNNNITTDPTFVSNGSDFHLQSGSGSKNTGTATGAPVYDIDGNQRSATAPSRGCYE